MREHSKPNQNERIKSTKYRASWKSKFFKAQAEIERLTKEHERIAWSKKEYMDWVHGFLSTHTDMKDRGEKFEAFDRDWMCNVFWEKIVGALDYIIDLENQRNELQKQVDELKAKNEHLDSENTRLICEMDKMLDDGWDIMDEEADGWYKKGSKDTANEILDDLRNIFLEQSSYGCDANQHIGYYDYEVKIGLVIEQIEEYAKEKYDIEYGVEVE
jgi:regulator of replication initiation timing